MAFGNPNNARKETNPLTDQNGVVRVAKMVIDGTRFHHESTLKF